MFPANHPDFVLGTATLVIQDHADSETPPPPRTLAVNVVEIHPNPDGSYTMPDGSLHVRPPEV